MRQEKTPMARVAEVLLRRVPHEELAKASPQDRVRQCGEAVIICGDCLEVMRGMDASSVDAVVTDPPYGIGFLYGDGKEMADNPHDYWEWLSPRYAEMMRLLRPGGFFAMWQAQLNFKHFWDWFGDDIHIYAACKNFVQLRKTPINYGYDPVVMKYKAGAEPIRPTKPQRNLDFFIANTAGIIRDKHRPEKAHPCPRPLDAVIQIVRNFVIPEGLILDPFMGSGTTLIAAGQEGCRAVGIELNEEYCEIARRRTSGTLPQ